jgi:hypothetical protein
MPILGTIRVIKHEPLQDLLRMVEGGLCLRKSAADPVQVPKLAFSSGQPER